MVGNGWGALKNKPTLIDSAIRLQTVVKVWLENASLQYDSRFLASK